MSVGYYGRVDLQALERSPPRKEPQENRSLERGKKSRCNKDGCLWQHRSNLSQGARKDEAPRLAPMGHPAGKTGNASSGPGLRPRRRSGIGYNA